MLRTFPILLLILAPAATAAPQLLSVNSAGSATGNARTIEPRFAPGGRYVVFSSRATDLVTGVTDAAATDDVFRRDLATGTTTLVSRAATGSATGNGGSYGAFASADGRSVAFSSNATDLVAGADANTAADAFVRDLTTDVTVRISNAAGTTAAANGASEVVAISDDGRVVLFASYATNLTTLADTNNATDVFAYDRQTGQVELVSVNRFGTAAGNQYSEPIACLSRDGRFVVFTSTAGDLVANDVSGESDIFLRDRVAGTTEALDLTPGGVTGDNGGLVYPQCVSDDGRYVVFESYETNVVPIDTTAIGDIYVRDRVSAATTLVSVNAAGTAGGNNDSYQPAISADGRYVAFGSNATNLVAATTTGTEQIYWRDLQTQTTRLVSHNAAGNGSNSNAASPVAMNPRGDGVAFKSVATDLAGGADANAGRDVFLWQAAGGAVVRVSSTSAGDAANGISDAPAIAADGSVAFDTLATNLGATDANAAEDVYLWRSALFADGFE